MGVAELEDFAHPGTIHAFHSISIALTGTILVLLGVKEAAADGDDKIKWVRSIPRLPLQTCVAWVRVSRAGRLVEASRR